MIASDAARSMATVAILAVGGDDADSQLSLIIAGLLGLALLILIVTIIYWRMTKPSSTRRADQRHALPNSEPLEETDAD